MLLLQNGREANAAPNPRNLGSRSVGLAAILKKEHRMSNHRTSISGLTDEEAQEFHQFWIQGTVGFTAVAVLAHILVWAWRPWF